MCTPRVTRRSRGHLNGEFAETAGVSYPVAKRVRQLEHLKNLTLEGTMEQSMISPEQDSLKIWTNPTATDLAELPDLVRFTAVLAREEIHVWDYSRAFHTDISERLNLGDRYDSPGFPKGAAVRQTDGRFMMFQSHYLEAFKKS